MVRLNPHISFKADKIFDAVQDTTSFLATTFAIQATTTAASMVLQNAGKKLVDSGDIQADAAQAVGEIVASNQDPLARIYATDAINGNTLLQHRLHRGVGTMYPNCRNIIIDLFQN